MEYMDAGTLQQFVHNKLEADEQTLAAVARGVLKVSKQKKASRHHMQGNEYHDSLLAFRAAML